MRTETLRLWLLVVLSFLLTMPGAIAFANWDAPYGFYKDLSVWLSCVGSALLFVLLYGFYEWKRGRITGKEALALLILWMIVILTGLKAQREVCGQMGYQCGLLAFVLGGFVGLFLSMMLFPTTLIQFLTGKVYPYDRPLVIVWYLLLATAIALARYIRRTHGTG